MIKESFHSPIGVLFHFDVRQHRENIAKRTWNRYWEICLFQRRCFLELAAVKKISSLLKSHRLHQQRPQHHDLFRSRLCCLTVGSSSSPTLSSSRYTPGTTCAGSVKLSEGLDYRWGTDSGLRREDWSIQVALRIHVTSCPVTK